MRLSAFSAAIELGYSQLSGLLQKVKAVPTCFVLVQRKPLFFYVIYHGTEISSWFLLCPNFTQAGSLALSLCLIDVNCGLKARSSVATSNIF